MLFVYTTEPGLVEVSYMWLPTWIGMNPEVKKDLEKHLNETFKGAALDLPAAHNACIDYLCNRFKEVEGLRAYLGAVCHVNIPEAPNGS